VNQKIADVISESGKYVNNNSCPRKETIFMTSPRFATISI
jgi:hypothetical protein